jgi:hypothetical protein
MSVFSSEFWRSLYFLGMGGQASVETEPGQMAARLTGSGYMVATISGGERETETPVRRKGGKDDRRRPIVPQYVEWTKERELAIARHEKALFAELLDEEPPPLPVAEKRGLDPAKELERINLLILQAMQAAADDAKRKDRERLRKEARRSKVAPPTTQEDTKALVYWLVKRAEALREAEEDDEETILLLAA